MSDLANSCEYLTIDNLCSAVSESEKAKANREAKCLNDEKMSCCYICKSRSECPTKCRYLGNTEKEPMPVETKKTTVEITKNNEINQTNPAKQVPIFCSSCNIEMSEAKTQFKINGWKRSNPKIIVDRSSKEESLPVLVYLCPQCGKIEFKADEGQ